MGALVAKALRPIKSFNIENRAHRVISKEKPTPAPKYAKNLQDLQRTLEADPSIADKLDKKDPELDNRLRGVYVTATGKPEDDITRSLQIKNPNRPLPNERRKSDDFEYGFKEPEKVTYGRTTMRHVMDFLSAYQINPKEVTSDKIAMEYKLKKEDVDSILKHFKTFELYIPKTKTSDAIFAGPSTSKRQLEQIDRTAIEDKTTEAQSVKPDVETTK